MKNYRKSQEEMVGFVLIILLVVVIGLVFLVISIRKSPVKLPSEEIESFLQSSMRYSTDCYSSPEIRQDVEDLIVSCYKNEKCLNGKTSCEILNETLSKMLKESWNPGAENPNKAYNFKIYGRENNQTILFLKQGNAAISTSSAGADVSIPTYLGIVKAELELYV